jgi:hypothetical protein
VAQRVKAHLNQPVDERDRLAPDHRHSPEGS